MALKWPFTSRTILVFRQWSVTTSVTTSTKVQSHRTDYDSRWKRQAIRRSSLSSLRSLLSVRLWCVVLRPSGPSVGGGPKGAPEDSPYARNHTKGWSSQRPLSCAALLSDRPGVLCVRVLACVCVCGCLPDPEKKGTHIRCGAVSAKIKHIKRKGGITCGKSRMICC